MLNRPKAIRLFEVETTMRVVVRAEDLAHAERLAGAIGRGVVEGCRDGVVTVGALSKSKARPIPLPRSLDVTGVSREDYAMSRAAAGLG